MERSFLKSGEVLVAYWYIFFPLIIGMTHIFFKKKHMKKVEILLNYYIFIGVGVQGVVTGLLQVFKPQMVASIVEWAYSPFLIELGMANLAFGIVGLVSIWLDGSWKTAAATGYGLFLLFTGVGHLINIMMKGANPGDVGGFLWSDLLVPVALFTLIGLQAGSRSAKSNHAQ